MIVVAVLVRHNVWLWGFGVFFGCLLGAWIALLESPPGRIENWRTGYEGERRTARVLAPLRRRGYVLLHNLPDRRSSEQKQKGDIDHVVICSGGVFLLNSKWLGGEVSIDRDTGRMALSDLPRQAALLGRVRGVPECGAVAGQIPGR